MQAMHCAQAECNYHFTAQQAGRSTGRRSYHHTYRSVDALSPVARLVVHRVTTGRQPGATRQVVQQQHPRFAASAQLGCRNVQ